MSSLPCYLSHVLPLTRHRSNWLLNFAPHYLQWPVKQYLRKVKKRNERIAFNYTMVKCPRVPSREYPKCLHRSNHLEVVNRVLPILCKENGKSLFCLSFHCDLCFVCLNPEIGFVFLPGKEWSENIVKSISWQVLCKWNRNLFKYQVMSRTYWRNDFPKRTTVTSSEKLLKVNSPCILDNVFFIVTKISVNLCKLLMTSCFLLSFTELIRSIIAWNKDKKVNLNLIAVLW